MFNHPQIGRDIANRAEILGYFDHSTESRRIPCFWCKGQPVQALTRDGLNFYHSPGNDHPLKGKVCTTLEEAWSVAEQIYEGRNFRRADEDGGVAVC